MQEQIVRPIRLQSENAGVDFMAYMHRSGKCEIYNYTSHGLHQYTNKKSPQKGRGYGQVTYLSFYFPLKDGGGGQFEKRKICTWKIQEQIAWPI